MGLLTMIIITAMIGDGVNLLFSGETIMSLIICNRFLLNMDDRKKYSRMYAKMD